MLAGSRHSSRASKDWQWYIALKTRKAYNQSGQRNELCNVSQMGTTLPSRVCEEPRVPASRRRSNVESMVLSSIRGWLQEGEPNSPAIGSSSEADQPNSKHVAPRATWNSNHLPLLLVFQCRSRIILQDFVVHARVLKDVLVAKTRAVFRTRFRYVRRAVRHALRTSEASL